MKPSFAKLSSALLLLSSSTTAIEALDAESLVKRSDEIISPFFLNVHNPNRQSFAPEYLLSSGAVTPTWESASLFTSTNYGGLSTANPDTVTLYLSTSGGVASQPWQMGLSLQAIYDGLSLNSTEHGQVLTWMHEDRQAQFCQGGEGLTVAFGEDVPENNCELVDLVAFRPK